MSEGPVDDAFVREAARTAGLGIGAEVIPGVLANLERIAGFARMLDAVPLEPQDEAAPVWRP